MSVLYLRSEVEITALVNGEAVTTCLIPSHVHVHCADHRHADTADVEIEGTVLPYPVESTDAVFIKVYLSAASEPYASVAAPQNLRFCGYVDDEEVDHAKRNVRLMARDLSAPLRDHKPLKKAKYLGSDGAEHIIDPFPRYSDGLADAIKLILSAVPGWRDPKAVLIATLRENDAVNVSLSALTGDRQRNGPVGIRSGASAWEAIETVCGLAARTVKVMGREIVVRTPRETFDDQVPPAYEFVFGTEQGNAFGPSFRKRFVTKRKGIRLIAWDPTNRKRLEAIFPPDDELRGLSVKRPSPRGGRAQGSRLNKSLEPPDRDVFGIGACITTQSGLDAFAEMLWKGRTHGEISGTISSPIWDDKILALRNGDRIKLSIRPDLEAQMRGLSDNEARVAYLQKALGVEAGAAAALVRAAMKPHDDLYYVRAVSYEWPGPKAVTVEFSTFARTKLNDHDDRL